MEPDVLYICEKEYNKLAKPFTQSVLHSHNHIEISLVFTGEAEYFIEDDTYVLKSGQLIIFTPGTRHSVTIPKQTAYRDLHIGISHLIGHLAECSNSYTNGFLIVDFNDHYKEIAELTKDLVNESNCYNIDCKLMLQALVLQLLVRLSRLLDHPINPKPSQITTFPYPDKHVVVSWITKYIKENYMKEISLEMFAKDMYLSQVYISKIFKEETGHSPIHFLIQTRLSVAKSLLETQALPIKEISRCVGYEDAYHFSKLFKKYYGISPSAIRKASSS